MNLKSFHHVAIICSEYQRSKQFYVDVLGAKITAEQYRADRQSYKLDLQLGESRIELFSFPNPPTRPSHPEAQGLRHVAFVVEDLDTAVNELTEKGVLCESVRVDPYTQQRFTFFSDPDGLPLELYEVVER